MVKNDGSRCNNHYVTDCVPIEIIPLLYIRRHSLKERWIYSCLSMLTWRHKFIVIYMVNWRVLERFKLQKSRYAAGKAVETWFSTPACCAVEKYDGTVQVTAWKPVSSVLIFLLDVCHVVFKTNVLYTDAVCDWKLYSQLIVWEAAS